MKTSAELREEADFLEGQEKLAEEALATKGNLARFYSAQYSLGPPFGSKRGGTFVGLACKSCNRWSDGGHDENCAVAELEKVEKNG